MKYLIILSLFISPIYAKDKKSKKKEESVCFKIKDLSFLSTGYIKPEKC